MAKRQRSYLPVWLNGGNPAISKKSLSVGAFDNKQLLQGSNAERDPLCSSLSNYGRYDQYLITMNLILTF